MSIFREIREGLRLSQAEMADKLGISRQYWQRVEAGSALLGDEVGRLLESEVGALPLSGDGLRPQQVRDWTLIRPTQFILANQEPWQRAVSNWGYGISRLELPARLKDWMARLFPCDSALECFGWMQLATLKAGPLLDNPHFLGFRALPIVDQFGRALGERKLPGLYGSFDSFKFLVWPQVGLRPGRATFKADGLVWLKKARCGVWAVLEYDGSGHDHSRDKMRRSWLKLDEIRIGEPVVLAGRAAESFCLQARTLLSRSASHRGQPSD